MINLKKVVAELKTTEKITIPLSLAAFVLSFTGFYYQNLRVAQHLKASAINLRVQNKSVTFQVALINTGNKPVVAINAYPVHIRKEDDNTTDLFDSLGPPHPPPTLPLVLKPGEMRLVSLHALFNPADYYDSGEPGGPKFDEYQDARKVRIGASFSAMDSHGAVFNNSFNFFDVYLTKKALAGHDSQPKVVELLK